MPKPVTVFLRKTLRNKLYIAIGIITIIAISLFVFKGVFIAAVVNGRPIYRLSVIQELEKQAGAQVLDTLINEELIHQETANKKVSVSQGELDKEVASIKKVVESQGQNLEDVLTTQGLSLVDFKEQVRVQIVLEKLLKDQVSVTDEEINKYLEENKETIPQDLSKKKARQAVQDQLKTQKLNQAVQALIEKLQKDASISHFVGY